MHVPWGNKHRGPIRAAATTAAAVTAAALALLSATSPAYASPAFASPAHTGSTHTSPAHTGLAHVGQTGAAAAGHPASAAGTISTIAGGVGGPGQATGVGLGPNAPCGVSYTAGRVYIADSDTVREVNPQTDALTTPAGTALEGAPRVNRPATEASGLGTCSVVTDTSGNLIMATGREQIMMVPHASGTHYGQPMKAGHLYSIAGSAGKGFSGDGGPATKAKLDHPDSVAVDSAGNVLITDFDNNRVRVIAARTGTFYPSASASRS
jgi:NHL repeat